MATKEQMLFRQRQAAPLESKIAMSKDRLRKFVDWCEDNDLTVYQSYSGGRDSVVVRHLLQSIGLGGTVTPVFSNTGLELPEIVKFARKLEGLVEVKPKKHFREVWDTYGMPIGSKMTAKKLRVLQEGLNGTNTNMHRLYDTGIKRDGTAAPSYKLANKWRHLVHNEHKMKFTDLCCDHLKKEPLDTYQKTVGGGRIDGMRAAEGGERGKKHVCTVFDGKKPHSSPILFWSEEDVLAYLEMHDIEVCEVYYDRVFDSEGECLACDSKHTTHPTVAEWESEAAPYVEFGLDGDGTTWKVHKDGRDGSLFFFIQGEKRTGCSFCGFGAHLEKGANRFQKLSVAQPRLHNIIMNRMSMSKAMDLINVPINFKGWN